MRGVLVAFGDGAPEHLTPVLLSEAGHASMMARGALVDLLLSKVPGEDAPVTRSRLQEVFQPRQTIVLDPTRLGKWSYQLSCLKDRQMLCELISRGEGALRAWRGEDMDALLDGIFQCYNDLNTAWMVANVPHGASLLPLLMYAPGVDVATWIEAHREPLREALVAIGTLDARGRFDDAPRCRAVFDMVAGYLDAPLPCPCEDAGAWYALGTSHRHNRRGAASLMALCALCKGGLGVKGVSEAATKLARIGQQDDGSTVWVEDVLWKMAHVYPEDETLWSYFLDEVCRPLRQNWLISQTFTLLGEDFLRGCRTLDERGKGGYLPGAMEPLRDMQGGKKLVYQIARALLVMMQQWAKEYAPSPEACVWPSQGELWRAVWSICQGEEDALASWAWVGEILWYEIEKAWEKVRASSAGEVARQCARILLSHPQVKLPGLTSCATAALSSVESISEDGEQVERLRVCWSWLREFLGFVSTYHVKRLLEIPQLTAWEGRVILRHSFVMYNISVLPGSVKKRRKVLEQIDMLERANVLEQLDPESGWLLKLLTQFDFSDGYALTVMASKIASQATGLVAARQIQALCRAGKEGEEGAARSIHETFSEWIGICSETACEAHRKRASELATGFTDTSEARGQIEQYLQHRRLLGEPEELSKNIMALIAQQSDAEGRASQVRAIRGLLEGELPEARREKLSARLEKLCAPQDDGELKSIRRRASNLLASSLEQLMERSFEHCLSRAMLEALESLCGERYPEEKLTPELRVLLTVSQSEEFHLPLFKRYIQLALGSGDIGELEENARWARAMREREGFDLDAWRAGFEHETSLGEKTLHIHTERDLILGAHMGTGFDSCLSLENGVYAMSALGHNLEMNKHVIYVRVSSGEVTARKLVAIDREKEMLLGYPIYCKDEKLETQFAYLIDMAVARFARACGLTLGEHGEPEFLIKSGFDDDEFYLDGVVPWSVLFTTSTVFPSSPKEDQGWSEDVDAQMEWAYLDACQRGDAELLSAIAWRKRAPWSGLAQERLIALDRELARKHLAHEKFCQDGAHLLRVLWLSELFGPEERVRIASERQYTHGPWEAFERMFAQDIAGSQEVELILERACVTLKQIDRSKDLFRECSVNLYTCTPFFLAHAGVSTLITYMKRLFELARDSSEEASFRAFVTGWGKTRFCHLLRLCWTFHGPDIEALFKGLSEAEDDLSVLCLCEVAREVQHVTFVSPLRQLWKSRLRQSVTLDAQFSLYRALRHQQLDDRVREQIDAQAREMFMGTALQEAFCLLDGEEHVARNRRALRRLARRALESTAAESRATRCNQITMASVAEALQKLGEQGGEAAAESIKELAKMCHVVDIAEHESALANLLSRQEKRWRCVRAEEKLKTLETMHTLAHGSVDEATTLLGEILHVIEERKSISSERDPFLLDEYFWFLLGHRHDELARQEELKVRGFELLVPKRTAYIGYRQMETVFRWAISGGSPREALTAFFDGFSSKVWCSLSVLNTLCQSLVYAIGSSEEKMSQCAAFGFYEVLTRHHDPYQVLCIFEQVFLRHHDATGALRERVEMLREAVIVKMVEMDSAEMSAFMEKCLSSTHDKFKMSNALLLDVLDGLRGRWEEACWEALREDLQKRASNNTRARALLSWLETHAACAQRTAC